MEAVGIFRPFSRFHYQFRTSTMAFGSSTDVDMFHIFSNLMDAHLALAIAFWTSCMSRPLVESIDLDVHKSIIPSRMTSTTSLFLKLAN